VSRHCVVVFTSIGMLLAMYAGVTPQNATGFPARVWGTSRPVGAGSAQSWITIDGSGVAASGIGVSFDEGALQDLGPRVTETVIPLPAAPDLPFRDVVIDWVPNGRPEGHLYDAPHFEVYFYMLDEATRLAMGSANAAAGAALPADILPQPELRGGAFSATPVYGFWDGHLACVEAMVTLDYLRSKPTRISLLPQPPRFEQHGLYPTEWSVSYEPDTHRYSVAFSRLALR